MSHNVLLCLCVSVRLYYDWVIFCRRGQQLIKLIHIELMVTLFFFGKISRLIEWINILYRTKEPVIDHTDIPTKIPCNVYLNLKILLICLQLRLRLRLWLQSFELEMPPKTKWNSKILWLVLCVFFLYVSR